MQSNILDGAALVKAAQQLVIPGVSGEEIERITAGLKRIDLGRIAGLTALKVKILGNITTDYLTDHVRLMLARAGFAANIQAGHYGGLVRGLLGEESLTASDCDACILALTYRDIQFPPPFGATIDEARDLVAREVAFWTSLLERSKVPTAVMSFDLPPYRILDEQDGLAPGGLGWHIKMVNLEIAGRLPVSMTLIDAEALQYRIGAANWFDDRLYHLCKQPFSMEALPEIAHTIVSALTGLLGRGRKVLVLDLDNTLWGGVVGDDGLQGIELGPETADGEAFATFQAYTKQLSKRGIVLAVCSKNRDEVARAVFREHSAMVLKEEDISCFVANFNDKAANLRHIARSLNVGLDSLVFVDDNPVERSLIRSELPEVMVVEMPDDPAYYVRALEASKAFPLRALTREDLGRVASYRAMAAVQQASADSGTDMEQFLIGLQPVVHVERVNQTTVDRIVQLVRKTNQFKLNLIVFQEAEVLEFAPDVLALKLVDRLQDYGIVAIAVTQPVGDTLHIRNWVMSCRVFGRRLEDAMLELLVGNARARGCSTIKTTHTLTEKNVIIPDILLRLGFKNQESSDEYCRGIDGSIESHHMTIIDRRTP